MKLNKDTDQNEVLTLIGLDHKTVESVEIVHLKDCIEIRVTLACEPHICPVCGNQTSKIKGYTTKKITHSVINFKPCYIIYRARRFECRTCHKTFYENNPFTFDGMKISLATVYNILNDLKDPRVTFTQVAQRYHISPTAAANIFDQHVSISRRMLPEYINFDEVYAFESKDSKYVFVIVDYLSQNIVDLLPSRKQGDLLAYFNKIPLEERKRVKIVCCDMWESYRYIAKTMFPNALISTDKFHIIQEMVRKVDKVRIRVMNEIYDEKKKLENKKKKDKLTPQEVVKLEEVSQNYYVLKKFHWTIFRMSGDDLDPNRDKKYNSVMKRYMNYYYFYAEITNMNNDIGIASILYYHMHRFYKNCRHANAQKELDELLLMMHNSNIPEMTQAAKTFGKWKKEIVNSFIVVETKTDSEGNIIEKKVNNGIIENRNKSIKLLKHSSNGYTNWERFRNRILYSLNNDTTYRLYPKRENGLYYFETKDKKK